MIQMKTFSVGQMVKQGWSKFKENPTTWIVSLLIIAFVFISQSFVSDLLKTGDYHQSIENFKGYFADRDIEQIENSQKGQELNAGQFILYIVYFLLQQGLWLGLFNMSLRSADGLPIHVGHLFSRFQYVFHYFFATIFFSVIVFVGSLLLIFPAFIWAARFGLFPYFIVDKGAGPISSLKMSSQATFGAKWDIFAFSLVQICLLIAGFLALLFGLLIALPICNIAWGCIYRHLTSISSPQVAEKPTEG